MLAKAGESDRAIRVKMVRLRLHFLIWKFHRPLILGWTLGVGALTFYLFLCFIFDANMTFFFTHFFLAQASLLWKTQGRQDQSPIDTSLGTLATAFTCSLK